MKTRDVLFATDFSELAEMVGAVARDTARGLDAALHVVHVAPPGADLAEARGRLARVASSLAGGGVQMTALLSGRPAREIVAYARGRKVGLIVIGSHGRTGLSRALLGSVAEAVVRLAPCPVLTVPPPATDAAAAGRPAEAEQCLICAAPSDDLICERCRTRIRAEGAARAARPAAEAAR